MASTSISVATSGTPTNNKKFTFSFWVKRHKLGSAQNIYIHERGSGFAHTHKIEFGFHSSDSFFFGTWDGSNEYYSRTKRKFKDTNAWMHIMIVVDSTQSTNTNRLKWYFNGEQYTIDGAAYDAGPSYPAQNWVFDSNTWTHNIGRYVAGSGASNYLDASLSDFCFVDGQALTPSSFGETDTDTGEWRIKDFTAGDITWGTNGYRILKDGNSITDVSSNSHNFTSDTGTLTKTEDCPSNVFASFNPLVPDAGSSGLYHGNTQHNVDTANWRSTFSTLGMTTGKYYFEALKSNGSHGMIGVRGVEQCNGSYAGNNDHIGVVSQGWALYNADGIVKNNNNDVGSSIGTYANGDYMGCFLDCDNSKLYFSKNGTMMNTTGYSITAGLTYMFGVSGHSTYRWVCNFGNGAFGATQLTGTTYNGSDGNGIFKYNPNNITLDGSSKSFKSLSTKGLNT